MLVASVQVDQLVPWALSVAWGVKSAMEDDPVFECAMEQCTWPSFKLDVECRAQPEFDAAVMSLSVSWSVLFWSTKTVCPETGKTMAPEFAPVFMVLPGFNDDGSVTFEALASTSPRVAATVGFTGSASTTILWRKTKGNKDLNNFFMAGI
jgi:hypothetical protein